MENQALKRAVAPFSPDRFPHAVALLGPAGSGRLAAARLLAAGLFCAEADGPCMGCVPCKKALAFSHPDLFFFDNSDGKMTVDQIRALRREAFIRPGESDRRVFILRGADKLTVPCQNALLKLLEEPPPGVVFLLIGENANGLLPTVRSRVVSFELQPLSEGAALSFLRTARPGKSDAAYAEAAALSGGIAGRALEMLERADSPTRALAVRCLTALAEQSELSFFTAVHEGETLSSGSLTLFFDDLRALAAEGMLLLAGGRPTLPEGERDIARLLAKRFTLAELSRLSSAFIMLRERADAHGGVAALLGTLAAECAVVAYC